MTFEREQLFNHLESLVGETPLYEIKSIKNNPQFNGCRIFCKEEYKNPTGSHYDRFWVEFFRALEENGTIDFENLDNHIVETSTGNSGASFAWICRALGYPKYHVVIPADMPDMRKRQIKDCDAIICESPEKQYIRGLVREFTKRCAKIRRLTGQEPIMPNHATDGTAGLHSMEKIAHEIIAELKKGNIRVDFHVTALGNGIATSGVSKVLKKEYGTKIIGVEPKECPTFYHTKRKEKRPKNDEFTHRLYGTGSGDSGYDFPILDSYLDDIDDISLVSEKEWAEAMLRLQDCEGKFVGHTSAACFVEACKIAKANRKKNIVIIFYDADWKYFENYVKPPQNACVLCGSTACGCPKEKNQRKG